MQANLNKDGELRCMASGQPKVSYTWVFSHNYERLILKSQDNRDNKFLVSKTKFSYYDGKELSESILTIKNVQRKDWGEYKCIVESKIGYDQKEFQFKGNGMLLHLLLLLLGNYFSINFADCKLLRYGFSRGFCFAYFKDFRICS